MEYKIVFVDHILDNIYGQIGITQVEKELEKKPIFKRLHHISQLGLTNLIYPCALHNRYIHSIGVMHTAYNMAVHINMNYAKTNSGETFFSDTELQIIRLAGMLHDIGHYPMSHNIELAYKSASKNKHDGYLTINDQENSLVNYPSFLKDDGLEEFENYIKQFERSSGYHHEAIGKNIIENNEEIYEIIKDNFVGNNKDLFQKKATINEKTTKEATKHLLSYIASIVVGDYLACDNMYNNNEYKYNKKYSAIIQLIHSELDADNLDYLMRDSMFSGTSYGSIDISVLLNNLEVREISEKRFIGSNNKRNTRTKYLVGINKKGINLVDQFFINKFFSYTQVIFNKYVSSLEFMLLEWSKNFTIKNKIYSIKYNDNKDINFLPLVKSKDTKIEYLNFTDSYILEEIHKKSNRKGQLQKCIYSRLVKNMAFELDKSLENGEFITIGDKVEINNCLTSNSKLYKKYKKLIEEIGRSKFRDLSESKKIELLSFRFETYSITKQVKIERINELSKNSDNIEHIIYANYCRLANGIPVFEDNSKYSLNVYNNSNVVNNNIPKLIVDCESSLLSKIHDYRFVSIRKYKIEELK